VILGHTFPIFLGFKGGKGVATGFGVFLALAPMAVLIALGVFVVVVLFSKMISLGSITAALVLSAGVVMTKCWPAMWVLTWLIAAFVIYKHRSNIRRILDGNENKITLFRK
jgi:glycerol-3-phosphate acyltransferase PlsY